MGQITKRVLHVGCGAAAKEKLHPAFRGPEWEEVRLDIDPDVKPDIIASLTHMPMVEDGSMDAIYSSHNLEHLYPHEVEVALREFFRVLKTDGVALLTMPDLQTVAAMVATGGLNDTAYLSSMGPIAPLDILYGFRPSLAQGNHFMAHKTGFTGGTLMQSMISAGFAAATVHRHPSSFSLWGIGFRDRPQDETIRAHQAAMFPA